MICDNPTRLFAQTWHRLIPTCNLLTEILIVAYGAAAVAAPQLWQTADAPRYRKGLTADVICLSCIIIVFLVYRIFVLRENKRRDALEGSPSTDFGGHGVADKTDRQDMALRYVD